MNNTTGITPRGRTVIIDTTGEEEREKGSLIKEKKHYQTYFFQGHKIPQLLRGAQQHIFAATIKILTEGYLHEYYFDDCKITWVVTPALRVIKEGKNKGKTFNVGRLNDTDLKIWNCILRIARDQVFNSDFLTNKIKINRYEICKMLDINPTKSSYDMIEESLYRLTMCATELSIYNKKTHETILVSLGGYLDEFALYDIRGRRPNYAEKQLDIFSGETKFSYVIINKRRFDEIKHGYITKISFDLLINKLSTPLSRSLYTILNVRNQENPVKLSLDLLKGLTGQVKLRESKILNAASELKKYNFLKDYNSYKSSKKIFFRFIINKNFYEEEQKQFEIDSESDPFYKAIMKIFHLTLFEAKEKIIDEFDFESVIKYLKFYIYEKKRGINIENPLAWFLKAIKEKWSLPAELEQNWDNNKIIKMEDIFNLI